MAPNDYHFRSSWRVLGTVDEVFDLISRSEDLPKWWPAAFLDALELEPGDEDGIGKVVRLETRGWLPYKLNWHLRVIERNPPHGFGFQVWGDFVGHGAWTFTESGAWTDVGFDWRVNVRKPLVRWLSFLVRPLFASNHRWAMAKGEESLRLALARAHAQDPALKAALMPPPGVASFPLSAPLWALVGLVALAGLVLRARR
jgi:hypothetical protein